MRDTEKPIIAITGSSGKTTTKEMIASILQRRRKTFKSIENGNDVWYTSQYVNQINDTYEAIVLEYGMTHSGNITQHCKLIQPNIGIITNVGTAHIGNFNDKVKGIALAKSELIKGMKPDGLLFLNADDTNSKLLETKEFAGKIFTVGILNHSNCQAFEVNYTHNGMVFQVNLEGMNHNFYIPIFGVHNVVNALFAIAITHQLGFAATDIQIGLETYYRTYGRLNVHSLKREITLIDDSYNAKPCAMKAAIDVLVQIGKGKNIVVFGSMLGLGDCSLSLHNDVGKYAANNNIDYLYTIGDDAEQIGKGAMDAGFSPERLTHFYSIEDLNNSLVKLLEPKTTILIKGYRGYDKSQGLKMTETIAYILKYIAQL
ncbi:UDP-N-acetylmuramoyl-tripeptide--D-alanyl-D-alanine ligase [Aneurinibacillus sp. Ricciae_BoGa-3]|uniref:UDP-N-acetylmuramoyl-tripeptide--D-alanyl-D- alanine ligase n=1 Tax=Aneurinibacillus sp. Ricciae_BoGa-3 TaxID=3022697 RepID=UPI0023426100|nr:UDP-N-acetylmuramoyl-tripeptide--D-alanyl-D-alanine ligase [Aneurinibacillus sp. Ricciae_BoGa-3]WCK53276.1 UDP-N-acetylmuramoyl-tripeptide--D-alanyl-D-alanine ligase [Aneurinibacillus sp. Ricciae_BoGa-3]